MGNWQVHRDFYSGKADPVGRKYRQAGGRAGKDRKMRMRGERERKGQHRTVRTGTKYPT
jgi:hypothetical protein